ncbi:hypothetical protein AVEN_146898-1 [Araneus ventricosus]|uniref:Uncharacterized protein n=1 Tax=Araneus ventricosus TaxID=182803 RepID=A0A4Y2TBW8_ARAVE|nr:hypothetical protein AVEN_146898-1 [Araneus ventricosus]
MSLWRASMDSLQEFFPSAPLPTPHVFETSALAHFFPNNYSASTRGNSTLMAFLLVCFWQSALHEGVGRSRHPCNHEKAPADRDRLSVTTRPPTGGEGRGITDMDRCFLDTLQMEEFLGK